MLRDPAFWGRASLAFFPALVGAVGVSYAGMAGINALWRLVFNRDTSGLFVAFGGIVYGVGAGVLVPCLLFGVAVRLTWWLTSHRLPSVLTQAWSPAQVVAWIALQIVTIPPSVCLTFIAYGLPWLFLGGGR